MKNLPLDSSLPSGVLGLDSNGTTSSSRHTSHSPDACPPKPKSIYSPLTSGAPTSYQDSTQYFSPHLQPVSLYSHRSSSLSPTRAGRIPSRAPSVVSSPPRHPTGSLSHSALAVATSQPRSVSVDTASPATAIATIRRLQKQNTELREAWHAERAAIEASRACVEDIYREENANMQATVVALQAQVQHLNQRVLSLERETATLRQQLTTRNMVPSAAPVGSVLPSIDLRLGGGDSTADFPDPGPLPHHIQRTAIDLPGPARQTRDILPSQGIPVSYLNPGSARISPSQQPEVSPFIPLDTGAPQPSTAHVDFLATGTKSDTPTPVVYVQDIHPELEGIPLKASAVQKPTFTDSEMAPGDSKEEFREASPPPVARRLASKEQTQRVLNAHELERLRMHAGHTPSHSLSNFPLVAAKEVKTVLVASSSTVLTQDDPRGEYTVGEKGKSADDAAITQPPNDPEIGPEPDKELAEPLMIRNIPAKDDLFFKLVNEKLEKVVLTQQPDGSSSLDGAAETSQLSSWQDGAPASVDAGSDEACGPDTEESAQSAPDDDDIPLRFRDTNNFGAPFGRT